MFSTILRFLFCATCFLIISINADSQVQPKLKIDVLVDGVSHSLYDGDTLTIANKEVIVRTSNLLTFDVGAIKFDYPKHYSFEAEKDFGIRTYTLDGNDFVVFYFEFDIEVGLETFVKEIEKKFGKKNCKTTNRQITLAGKTLKGMRLDIELLEQHLTYDMYEVKTDDFRTRFLGFQDAKNDDGTSSAESVETLGVIANSIVIR